MIPQDPIGVPIRAFCRREGIGGTTVRKMLAEGRIKAFRVGRRKLMIDVASYRAYVAKQQAEGLQDYRGTEKAVAARMANRAEEKRARVVKARKVKPAEALAMTLSDLGLA